MNEHWIPDLDTVRSTTGRTIHERLVHAMRRDIEEGVLVPEGKLPPQRTLAQQLGVGLGTITRAYAEAERLGLVHSAVGRGTFVSTRAALATSGEDEDGVIDLSLNVQSLDAVTARMTETLGQLQRRADLYDYVNYSPHVGLDWHRQAMATWLRDTSHFATADWQRLALTTGSQHGMALALDELCTAGDVVLTEAATFAGFLSIAAWRGLRVEGVAMDREGIIPAALAEAAHRFGSRVVYLQPTLHNPTTRTMSAQRREAIVALAREHDLTIIEDDVYGAIAFSSPRLQHTSTGSWSNGDGKQTPSRKELVPLAMLAPERTWYMSSVSKSLAPGLRVGALIAPDADGFQRLATAIRANCYAAATLGPLVVSQWIREGVAHELLRASTAESRSRLDLAQRMLGNAAESPSADTSLHLWLPMSELQAERVASTALRRGVSLTPPRTMLVNGAAVAGLRVCLNNLPLARLERGLRTLRSVLADDIMPARNSIV